MTAWWWRTALSVLLALLWLGTAAAQNTLTGRVVAVADGDTLTFLDSSNTQHRIRLQAIDAPESGQPFGNRSRQLLSELCHRKTPQSVTTAGTASDGSWARLTAMGSMQMPKWSGRAWPGFTCSSHPGIPLCLRSSGKRGRLGSAYGRIQAPSNHGVGGAGNVALPV